MSKKRADFFEVQKPHSRVKSTIVSEYFGSWVDIMKVHCRELTYLDLFSGPGQYEDGKPSTPLMIFDIVESKSIHSILKTFFYEKNEDFRDKLMNVLKSHNAYNKLRNKPEFSEKEVSSELISELPVNDCTFSFVDPHGYEISARLLASLVKNWGSDCIFYLSTQGIRRNIENHSQEEELIELFGSEGLIQLREKFKSAPSWHVKDRFIIKQIANRVVEIQGKKFFFLDFAMEFEEIEMVSYYLILVTHHHRGFAIMKEIMAKQSFKDLDGIPLYVYSESKLERKDQLQLHFGEKKAQLKTNLCRDFKNKTLKVIDILEKCHTAGYIHTKNNLKDALLELELENEVSIDPPREERPWRNKKPTLADDKIVTFHCR